MNKTIKKIIAREGLVIIGIALSWLIFILIVTLVSQAVTWNIKGTIISFTIIISCYSFYLFIRFIIWAIRALKER